LLKNILNVTGFAIKKWINSMVEGPMFPDEPELEVRRRKRRTHL
jgi:hypothetical protein